MTQMKRTAQPSPVQTSLVQRNKLLCYKGFWTFRLDCKARPALALLFTLVAWLLGGCDSPSSQASSVPSNNFEAQSKAAAGQVRLTGQVTFDQIPHSAQTGQLQPELAYPLPARFIKIDALADSGAVIDSSVTDKQGRYSLFVPSNAETSLRIWAQIEDTTDKQWSARVVDNTRDYAIYTLETEAMDIANQALEIDIHAAADIGGDSFARLRASAPFAILDAVLDGFEFSSEQHSQPLEDLVIAWSVDNIAAFGDLTQGEIGSSYYASPFGEPTIFLLGAIANDADDYDRSVILHEFGHYLMDQISRADSVGGSHQLGSKLDLRVAFNEAMGNLLSALINRDSLYVDSYQYQNDANSFQVQAQIFDLEDQQFYDGGWFSTASLSWLLYDVVDAHAQDDDELSAGWAKLYQAISSDTFVNFDAAVSIYTFLASYIELYPAETDVLLSLASEYQVHYTNAYGDDEFNDGQLPLTLPLHTLYDGTETELCSDSQAGDFNGADVRRLLRFEVAQEGLTTIRVQNSDFNSISNPDFTLYHHGEIVLAGFSAPAVQAELSNAEQAINQEIISQTLPAGWYLLEVFERDNADFSAGNASLSCFNVSIENGGISHAPVYRDCNNLASVLGDPSCVYDSPSTDALAL